MREEKCDFSSQGFVLHPSETFQHRGSLLAAFAFEWIAQRDVQRRKLGPFARDGRLVDVGAKRPEHLADFGAGEKHLFE